MAEHKANPKLVSTPVSYLCGDPDDRKAPKGAKINGEPGFPQRTKSPKALDEVTYESEE